MVYRKTQQNTVYGRKYEIPPYIERCLWNTATSVKKKFFALYQLLHDNSRTVTGPEIVYSRKFGKFALWPFKEKAYHPCNRDSNDRDVVLYLILKK